MKISELERRLLAAARAHPPSDAVPYAFEQRIMARLGPLPVRDGWADWSQALWRAAAPCVAIAIVLGVWSSFNPATETTSADLTQDFEQTVLAAITQDSEANW
jgi:transposase